MDTIPVSSYVIKVATLCNINCTYCYEYNMGDNSWKKMPKFMSEETVYLLASRIAEHCREHSLKEVYMNLHGGEPLLYGIERTAALLEIMTTTLAGIKIHWGIQTNGLLLDQSFVDLFAQYDFHLGLSLDGYKEANDWSRVDFSGNGTYDRVVQAAETLKSSKGKKIFAGILCVIQVESDPVRCFLDLLDLGAGAVDFLLPHHNWDNLPPSKRHNPSSMDYADWYIQIFDFWFENYSGQIQIRTFEEIIQHLVGGKGLLETIGLEPVSLLVIAANGDMEGVDTLKSIPGQQVLQLNIQRNSINDAMMHPSYRFRNIGAEALHETCRNCDLVQICGGGYLPHRWSNERGFVNPSVYCADLIKLIRHIQSTIELHIQKEHKHDPVEYNPSGL